MKNMILEILFNNEINNIIHTLRGEDVILDYDLANFYGYNINDFNKIINNNIERFDEDFRFQLTHDEYINIVKKEEITTNDTISQLPYAFSELGIYMLITTLDCSLAIEQSIKLIDLLTKIKNYIANNNPEIYEKSDVSIKHIMDQFTVTNNWKQLII